MRNLYDKSDCQAGSWLQTDLVDSALDGGRNVNCDDEDSVRANVAWVLLQCMFFAFHEIGS
jgi:hypothetical protein